MFLLYILVFGSIFHSSFAYTIDGSSSLMYFISAQFIFFISRFFCFPSIVLFSGSITALAPSFVPNNKCALFILWFMLMYSFIALFGRSCRCGGISMHIFLVFVCAHFRNLFMFGFMLFMFRFFSCGGLSGSKKMISVFGIFACMFSSSISPVMNSALVIPNFCMFFFAFFIFSLSISIPITFLQVFANAAV